MNRQLTSIFLTVGLSALLGSTTISAQENKDVADVPFAFQAAQTSLPAGHYTLQIARTSGVFQISNGLANKSIFLMTVPDSREVATEPHLTFTCYGEKCYLSEIWLGEDGGYAVNALTESNSNRQLSLQPRIVSVRLAAH